LDEAIKDLKKIEANISYYAENTEKLVDIVVDVRKIYEKIEGRIKRKVLREERTEEAKQVLKSAKELEKEIQNFIKKARVKRKKILGGKAPEVKSIDRIKKLPETKERKIPAIQPKRLVEVFSFLDLPLSDELVRVIELIDEKFVQAFASNKSEYLLILENLMDEIEDIISEE